MDAGEDRPQNIGGQSAEGHAVVGAVEVAAFVPDQHLLVSVAAVELEDQDLRSVRLQAVCVG